MGLFCLVGLLVKKERTNQNDNIQKKPYLYKDFYYGEPKDIIKQIAYMHENNNGVLYRGIKNLQALEYGKKIFFLKIINYIK